MLKTKKPSSEMNKREKVALLVNLKMLEIQLRLKIKLVGAMKNTLSSLLLGVMKSVLYYYTIKLFFFGGFPKKGIFYSFTETEYNNLSFVGKVEYRWLLAKKAAIAISVHIFNLYEDEDVDD